MKSKEKIIATLKKLKAMAERGCNEQEIETAARMLQKQMDKFGDQANLNVGGQLPR